MRNCRMIILYSLLALCLLIPASGAVAAADVAMIGQAGYSTVNAAYDKASSDMEILLVDAELGESLLLDRGIGITISGGYNQDFTSRTAQPSALQGRLVIDSGSLLVDGLAITSPTGVVSLWGGARHCLVLKSDGTVWAWGMNVYGKLGDGTVSVYQGGFITPVVDNDRHTPVQVHGTGNAGYLNSIAAIIGGELHNFALKTDGTVWSWGWNYFGQLGDGTNTDRYTPVKVSGLTSVAALGGRGYHSLALRTDGTVWAWGFNSTGQLGDGTRTDSKLPVPVTGVSGVLAVTGGYNFSLALMPDGTLRSWGDNGNGELGDGTNTLSTAPVLVKDLDRVVQVSAGWKHSVALRGDGTVWTWGHNSRGQLGDGTNTNRNLPVQVKELSRMIAVSGGDCHTTALRADGTVWAWGCNNPGSNNVGNYELGDGTNADSSLPVQVIGLTDVVALAARDYHNLALKADGTVWSWGFNQNGQLGDNTTIDRNIPVQVSGL